MEPRGEQSGAVAAKAAAGAEYESGLSPRDHSNNRMTTQGGEERRNPYEDNRKEKKATANIQWSAREVARAPKGTGKRVKENQKAGGGCGSKRRGKDRSSANVS